MALMLLYPDKYAIAQEIASELLDQDTHCKLLDRIKAEQGESA